LIERIDIDVPIGFRQRFELLTGMTRLKVFNKNSAMFWRLIAVTLSWTLRVLTRGNWSGVWCTGVRFKLRDTH
jgi:hypothetical protein